MPVDGMLVCLICLIREPKFNDFTAVTKYIARASETMQKSIETYAHWLLTEVPSNDRSNGVYYVDDPKSLPNVLLNGDFAEPRVTEILPNSIYVSLFSAAIAILWKGESANVIKIPHGVSFLPNACEQENFFEGNSWCDGEGNAYLLLGWDTTGKWAKAPWDGGLVDKYKDLKGIDKLSDYKLDIETVVKASEHAQSLNGGEPYYEWNTDRVIDHMNGGEQNLARFSGFNLPFCELHDFEGLDNENCGAEVSDRTPADLCYF